ncbi:hypothetical protein R3P38DRAFT_2784817 [Favolaschia claudopus]|uniref:Uncharacterized protein n=1 Tax=Favolaschia claudopus TaxID=2862362 RepID=A0AAW0AXQ9_9AGAR
MPNSLQVSLVSPQTPEQVSLRCYIDLNGKRKAWTESHTEYTRQPQSTDVKVWDNYPARTLSFGKETADQAIQQGNTRNVKEVADDQVNGSTYLTVQANGQQYITKCDGSQSINPVCLARKEAFDQHYKAIWLAGISDGIEPVK